MTTLGRSPEAVEYQKWYRIKRWKQLRALQLAKEPWCVRCTAMGRNRKASVVDHKEPHYGDPQLFWNPNNLQSLCAPHHDTKSREEQGNKQVSMLGDDGWPRAVPSGE